MVKLQEAENQIITAYEVYAQRPYDSDLLIPAIDIHQALLGRAPRLVAADAAFYSARNEAAAKAKGVRLCSQSLPPKTLNASASRESDGSATAGSGALDARGASASSNGDTVLTVARGLSECSAGSGSASSPITSSTSAALWNKRQSLNKPLAIIGF
jgi:hypothetical protein